MKDILLDEFQFTAQELLIKDKSIVDLITKFQDSNAQVNRKIVNAVTQCGCIEISANKQKVSIDEGFEVMKTSMKSHLSGTLCKKCRDSIEKEIGKHLFYLASVCNTMDLNIYDIILKELDRIKLLDKYTLR